MTEQITNPLIPQRTDPWVYRHTDGYYYFTAARLDGESRRSGWAGSPENLNHEGAKVMKAKT